MLNAEFKVKKALLNYKMTGDTNAGWNILRYAKQGYIAIDHAEFTRDFMAWYPNNPDYLILRLAQEGRLQYQKTDAQLLAELETE